MANPLLEPSHQFADDESIMRHALALAALGRGVVEPNPMVGAVLVDAERRMLADGYHHRYGEPHAEVDALTKLDRPATGETLFVTLEPCSHHGKQPPCVDAVIASGVSRVVCAMGDPFPEVAGRGFERLRDAGIAVEVGLCEHDARTLNAPFLTRIHASRPYVIAKYAMTLDGKMAASTGHSMWISGAESRAMVHELRRVVDGIVIGAGTAAADNPRLTARPAGHRTPARIVLDRDATRVKPDSYLAQTAREIPVRVYYTAGQATDNTLSQLKSLGVETIATEADDRGRPSVEAVLSDLATLNMTNVLLEGGAVLLDRFRNRDLIDEYRVFIAPKVIGDGLSPMSGGGLGLDAIPETAQLEIVDVQMSGGDVAIQGLVPRRWLNASP